jgi:phosphoenolpyruvate carboxylase
MDELPKIPRCMSTQHPDNVHVLFFAESPNLSGEDEVRETYYIYSHLGCREQMWDCEGKEVDNFVVKKLLSNYPAFFSEKKLG